MLGINKLLAFLRRSVGLRDDAASATGSLHAKVADIATNKVQDIKNVIGTSADNRASNTVMGWLNSPIKSIQRGQAILTAATSGAGVSIDVTISAVVMAKSVLVLSGMSGRRGSGGEALTIEINNSYYVNGSLTSTTNINFNRTNSGSNQITIAWQVIEYY